MTPRVQGEPIVLGSDFGLLPSQEGKDFISGCQNHATGARNILFNKSIEMDLCVNSDLFKSNNDIKVVTKMLDTYDSMSTKSQSAEALVTIPSTVVREGHKATQVALSPSQTESHTPSAPPWVLQSTGRGAEWDSVYMRFAQYLSTKEQQEVDLLTSMVNRWRQLGLSTMAISAILEGHQIPFRDGITPPYTGQVSTRLEGSVETYTLSKGLEGLLAKGVVEMVPPHLANEGYYNPRFSGPRESGHFTSHS